MRVHRSIPSAIEALDTAVSNLEAAVSRRTDRQGAIADMRTELELMRADRAKLGADLDAALARVSSLDTARGDAAERLEHAIGTIRSILGKA